MRDLVGRDRIFRIAHARRIYFLTEPIIRRWLLTALLLLITIAGEERDRIPTQSLSG
jgi:hypothetical protein